MPKKNFENASDKEQRIFNGIGNLVVLDRKINRKIKDQSVDKKVVEYENSKYVSVREKLVQVVKNCESWDIATIEKRQEAEMKKIMDFMDGK